MADCDDRQLTEAQRVAGYQNQRTGVPQALRPFTGRPTLDNLLDYINRELVPAVRRTRDAVNDIYLPVVDNAPSANPLQYYFSTDTTAADPTAGFVRLDASPQNTATTIRVSETNARLADATPWLEVMAGGVTSPLGVVTLSDAINPARFIRFDLTAMTDQGTYWDLSVTAIESSHGDPFVNGGGLVMSFIPGVASTGTTVPPDTISPIADDTFLANISGATAAPAAVALTTLAGAGLTGGENAVLNVGAGDGIDVAANDVSVDVTDIIDNVTITEVATNNIQRAALTGFAAASAGSNATTSAEPIVTFSASSNMSNERVLSNGTNTTVSTAVAGQISVGVDDLPLSALADQADDTFLANISGASAPPTAVALTTLAGAGLTGGADAVLNVGAGTGITVNANDVAVTTPLTDGDKGDITVATNGTAWTIDADVVTNTKLANMAQSTIKGRAEGGGTGDPQDLSATQVAAIIDGEGFTWTGSHVFSSAVSFGGSQTVSPVGVTDITLNAGVTHLFITPTGNWSLDELGPGSEGRLLVVEQFGGFTGTITHRGAGGVFCPDSVSFTITNRHAFVLRYRLDGWRVISQTRPAGGIYDGDKGDVTVSSNGTVWTIDNDVVSDAKLRNSAALSVIGRSANSTGDPADISGTASSDAVLRISGTALGFGTVATAGIGDNQVTDGKLRQSAGLSVIGRSANSTGNVADITAANDGEVLRRSGAAIGFGTIATDGLTDDSVTDDKLAEMAANTVKANNTDATANPTDVPISALGVLGRAGLAGTGNIESIDPQLSGSFDGLSLFLRTNVARTAIQWRPFSLGDFQPVSDNTFLGNISGASAAPTATSLSSLNSNSITYENVGKTFVREALGGDVTALQNSNTVTINADAVTDAKLRDSAALSVIGRSANSSGDPADIAAGTDGHVLRRSGTTLGFGTIATAGITDAAVTNAKLANMTAGTAKGRQIDAGTGAPVDLTGLEVGELIRFGTAQTETLAAATNNLTLNADTTVLRVGSTTGPQTLTGLSGGVSGRVVFVENVAATGNPITLSSQDAGSLTANRFRTPGGVNLVLGFRESAILRWDASNGDWRVASYAAQNAVADGDKGDITVSSSGATWTIDNDVVTDAKLRNSAAVSVIGRSANSSGDPADIAAAANDRLLARTSDSLAFQQLSDGMVPTNTLALTKLANVADNRVLGNVSGATGAVTAIDLGSFNSTSIIYENTGKTFIRQALTGDVTAAQNSNATTIAANAVSDGKLRDSAALSVIGRSANSTGDPADIAAGTDGHVLRRSGTTLGFGTIATAGITDAAVTLAKMADLAQSRIIGRAEGAGTGVPTALTPTQVVSIIDGEAVTWTGAHSFTGASHTVNVSGTISETSGSTANYTAGTELILSAGTRVSANSPFSVASSLSVGTVSSTSATALDNFSVGSSGVARFTGPPDPLTGIVPAASAQVLLLVNAHASSNMVINLESANSSAANRFAGTGTSRVIRPGEMALAWYDGTASRWRLLCRDEVDL